jgi:hypothetical protein
MDKVNFASHLLFYKLNRIPELLPDKAINSAINMDVGYGRVYARIERLLFRPLEELFFFTLEESLATHIKQQQQH